MPAQQHSANWCFGKKAGLTFSSGSVSVSTSCNIHTEEGVTSYSDEGGNLLFYSDGDTIWNRLHLPMPNGVNLGGNSSSTQSAAVCPMPGDSNKYYLFTVDAFGQSNGLMYSVIDITLDGGLGDIISAQNNIQLEDSVCEKIGLVEDCDKNGFWLIAVHLDSAKYLSYHITQSGVSIPVISYGIANADISSTQGYLKVSPNGRFVAACHEFEECVELMKFNNQTGQLYDPLLIVYDTVDALNKPYGLEFSPNSQNIYVSNRLNWQNDGEIYEFDISDYSVSGIQLSKILISDTAKTAALQLASDGRIYCSGDSFLHVIEAPNKHGIDALFKENEIFLQGRTAEEGLPYFIPNEFVKIDFPDTVCWNELVQFISSDSCANLVSWDFGDSASGSANTSFLLNPTHLFSDTGVFNVKLLVSYDSRDFFYSASIYVRPKLAWISQLSDTFLICDSSFTLNVDAEKVNFLWSDGSTNRVLDVTDPGLYALTVYGECDSLSTQFYLLFGDSNLIFQLPHDSIICSPNSMFLDIVPDSATSWLWFDGDSTSKTKEIAAVGDSVNVWLTVQNKCGTYSSDTATYTFVPEFNLDWFTDSLLCGQDGLWLNELNDVWASYSLKNTAGDTLNPWYIAEDDNYMLTALSACDTQQRTARLSPFQQIEGDFPAFLALCPEDEIWLEAYWPTASYTWYENSELNPAKTDSAFLISGVLLENGLTQIEVEVTVEPCKLKLQTQVSLLPEDSCAACKFYVPNVFSPNGDGRNDVLQISNSCNSKAFQVYIYNRWGMLVYSSNQNFLGWDGYINDAPAPSGVYFVVVEYLDTNNLIRSVRNAVELIR